MSKTEVNKEYIEDRSIADAGEDSFRHADVVAELADLALKGPAPSNIALFAPWGTGKSGIAKLLEPRIRSAKQRFVYFDAFKHRETPLRRSFLRAVVSELDPGALASIDTRLYGERTTQTLNESDKKKLFWMILGGVLGALALAGLVSLGLSKLHPGPFNEDFPGLFAKTSGVLALVGGLIGVALTSLINGYSVTRTSTPVAEDDEFEREFGSLVKGSRRVVIFVDELDRCSADDVVEALETMRVFLETTNCVFVVAIDQQSLEQALRRKARQETPVDDTHPYFSSAGSYIDKIFQYQVALPPLRSRDMEAFVRALVSSRPGMWADLRESDELPDVIGALAPTHVTSPRRIKVLLNSFVMSHRLARKRIAAEEMSPLDQRTAALAKLVCLRTEFPLFAEELDQFPQLPKAVLAQDRDEESELARKAPKTWGRARKFLAGELPLVPLLFRPHSPSNSEGDADAEAAESAVNGQHLANLLGYLRRVESLPEITRDLIYLHSAAGSGTSLEPLTADRIEEAARDGSVEFLTELLEADREPAAEVIGLLTSILTAAAPGSLDANNATHVLLAACELVPDLVGPSIDAAADEIVRQRGRRELEDRDLAQTVGLAVRVGGRRSAALVGLVGQNADLLSTPPARARLIREFPRLNSQGRTLAGQATASAILGAQDDAMAEIGALDDPAQNELLQAADPELSSLWSRALKRAEAAKEEAEEQATEPATPDAVTKLHEEWATSVEPALDQLIETAPVAATAFASSLLELNRKWFSDIVGKRLGALAPVTDPRLRKLALRKAETRESADRKLWLAPLAAGDMDTSTQRELCDVAAATWVDAVDNEPDQNEYVDQVLLEIERLAGPETSIDTAPVERAIAASLGTVAEDDAGDALLERAAAVANRLINCGLADPGKTPSSFVSALGEAVATVPPELPNGRPRLRGVFDAVRHRLGSADQQSLDSLFDKADTSPVQSMGLLRADILVGVAEALIADGSEVDRETVLEAVVEQIELDPVQAASTAAAWVQAADLSVSELWRVLLPYWSGEVPSELRKALMSASASLTMEDHQLLARMAFDRVFESAVPKPDNWQAIDLRGLSARWVVGELASRSQEENFDESGWRKILEICKQLTTGNAEIQRRIGSDLILPLASLGDDGFRLAVDHLGLVGKGKTGQSVIDSLSMLATTDDRRKFLSRRIGEDQGLLSSLAGNIRKRLFGDPRSDLEPTSNPSTDDPPESDDDPVAPRLPEDDPDAS